MEPKRQKRQRKAQKQLEGEMKKKGVTWTQLEKMAQDRGGWKHFINGLCFKGIQIPKSGN